MINHAGQLLASESEYQPMKMMAVVGARPNFMKVAPILWEMDRRDLERPYLVHTGQHYDQRLSEIFFDELSLPQPDVNLDVRSGSHAQQTAEVMKRFEPVVLENTPDLLIVVGDVNSTLACSLTAVKLGVPVAHIEAGLRSFDRSMPEEINRLLTDSLSQWLFVSERSGVDNLRHEGVPDERVHFVGNVMIDTLVRCRSRFEDSTVLQTLHLDNRDYAVLTLHRPSNVDDVSKFSDLMTALERLQRELTIVFPVHPRTRTALNEIMSGRLTNVCVLDPLGYYDFMKLVSRARLVLTDSGGIQEETTFLKVPCLTLRNNTERPVTITEGTNTLTGPDPSRIVDAALSILSQPLKDTQIPELWDGRAASRIVDVLFGAG